MFAGNEEGESESVSVSVNQHAVIIHLPLGDDEFGSKEERDRVFRLEVAIEAAIVAADAGEFDGNEFGGGEATLYCYGPDADRLFEIVSGTLREYSIRDGWAMKQYGPATDPTIREVRVGLDGAPLSGP